MKKLPELIAITTGEALPRDRARTIAAVGAGLPGLLLREPKLSDRELLAYASELREVSNELWLVVHDRAHLVNSPVLDGVHLGFRSLKPGQVREFVPAEKVIGFSSHVHDGPASWSGADYVFFGPVKETPSKAGLVEVTGFDGLRSAVSKCELPVVALGGLAPCDVQACQAAGVAGVACLSDILMAEEPTQRVAMWRAQFAKESEVDA